MIETKAAFAERKIRSLKIFYFYMEHYGYKHTHKLSQFETTELQEKLFDRLNTKEYQEFRPFVHSVQQATTRL